MYVSVSNPGLAAGSYSGQIAITSVYGNLTVPVTFTVGGTPGVITANPTALQFYGRGRRRLSGGAIGQSDHVQHFGGLHD